MLNSAASSNVLFGPRVQHSWPPVEPQVASRAVLKFTYKGKNKSRRNNCICAGWLALVVPRRSVLAC
jgi:hypothetical protein